MASFSSEKRYLGLDLGTTNSCLCYTRFNRAQNKYDDPAAIRFQNKSYLRSLVLFDDMGTRILKLGEQVYASRDYVLHPERVREQFKLDLGQAPTAPQVVTLFCQQMLGELRRAMNLGSEPLSDEFCTTVGVPAAWLTQEPHKVDLVAESVSVAGFPAVQAMAEPVGAMLYHAYRGDIRYQQHSQYWLVIDMGGGTTDLVILETAPSGQRPKIVKSFGQRYGGKDFDELLLEKHVLPRFWRGAPPDPFERLELLRFVREFKEKFSEAMASGKAEYTASREIGEQTVRITLTRAEFQSEELCDHLIDDFKAILIDAFQKSEYSLRDIERVILTGGSARWYFVREAIDGFFGREATVISANPELTIARGLALGQTDFVAEVEPIVISTTTTRTSSNPPGSTLPAVVSPRTTQETEKTPVELLEQVLLESKHLPVEQLDLRGCREKAKARVNWFTLGGGALALAVSPIPGVAQIPLTIIEGKLVDDISKIYGYSLTPKGIAAIVGGLLAAGTLVKIGVMEAATFVPGVGWGFKAAVAGGAIKVLGELVTRFFEEARQRELQTGKGECL